MSLRRIVKKMLGGVVRETGAWYLLTILHTHGRAKILVTDFNECRLHLACTYKIEKRILDAKYTEYAAGIGWFGWIGYGDGFCGCDRGPGFACGLGN